MRKLLNYCSLLLMIILTQTNAFSGIATLPKITKTCKEGTVYRIKNHKDLESAEFYPDLECIFNAGKIPSKIPYGTYHLEFLQIFNTRKLNVISELIFTGKLATRIVCTMDENGNTTDASIMWSNIGGVPRLPAGVRLGNVEELMSNLEDGEYYDGRDSLVVDFADDVASRCPAYSTPEGQRDLIVQKTETRNYYPLDQAFDLIRLVGIEEDGGRIYLAKVYMRNPFDSKVFTLSYISFINYDLQVNPDFKAGDALVPLPRSYNYTIGELPHLVGKLFPVDKMVGLRFKNRYQRKETRNKFRQILSRNYQLAKIFREDRKRIGRQRWSQINKAFLSAFMTNQYQK